MNRTEALEYLNRNGLSYVPLTEGTKECHISGPRHTPQRHEIKNNENIGVLLGPACYENKNLICLDFDGADYSVMGRFKDTLIVESSKGHRHYYYFVPIVPATRKPKEGLDILGRGSYAVFPSSRAKNKRGEWSTYEDNGKDIAELSGADLLELEELLGIEFELAEVKKKKYQVLLKDVTISGYHSRSEKDIAIMDSMVACGITDKDKIRTTINISPYYLSSKYHSRVESKYFNDLYEQAITKVIKEWPIKRAIVVKEYKEKGKILTNPNLKTVLNTILNYAQYKGMIIEKENKLTFAVSFNQLVDYTGISIKTVYKKVKLLETLGYITLERKGFRLNSSIYSLNTKGIDFNQEITEELIESLTYKESNVAVHDAFRSGASKSLLHLYPYLLKNEMTPPMLAKETGIKQSTCRAILRRFEKLGVVKRSGKYFSLLIKDLCTIAQIVGAEGKSVISYVKRKLITMLDTIDYKFSFRNGNQIQQLLDTKDVGIIVIGDAMKGFIIRKAKKFFNEGLVLRKYCME